jgi:pimeloyl-ACP methyl ester carboxylesterase
MVALGIDRGTIVGHSLGGGIAMQFAYQFPERCERMVLVSSGGLGREVHPLLRAATLPGSEWVLPWLVHPRLIGAGDGVRQMLAKLKLQAGTDLAEVARGFASLSDREARSAFIETMRAVLDPGGQRVSALDRLYLAESLPSLLIWGADDPIIPVAHGRAAHELMPGSRLEVMEGVGHFPQLERPREFASLMRDFVAETEAATLDTESMRARLLAGGELVTTPG